MNHKILLLPFLIIFITSTIYTQTGKISGRVYNEATNEPIPGANVILEGTRLGAAADMRGNYVILNIPPGKYDVVISAVGFVKTTIRNVIVSADKTTFLDVALKEEVIGLPEVVVQAERPLIDISQTSSRATITSDDISALPIANFQEALKVSPSNYSGYIRGGRRYETKYIIEGIDISDKYYEAFSGNYGGNLYTTYHGLSLTFRENVNLADVGVGAIEEINVNSGASSAELSQATGGVVSITLKEGRGKISGKAYFRYASRLPHKGPDLYFGQLPDGSTAADKYFGEKRALEAKGDPASLAKARLYSWTPGKYWYGNKPTIELETSVGGSLFKDLGFFTDIRFYETHGRFPNEFNRQLNITGKLTYNLTPSIKLTGIGFINDQGFYFGWKNRVFNENYKFFLEGVPKYTKGSFAISGKLTHALSSKTFYEIQVSLLTSPTEAGFVDSNGDGKVELNEDKGEFIKFSTPEEIRKYISKTDKTKFFTTTPRNESESEASFPSSGPYPLARPGAYYEYQRLTQVNVKGDVKSQITNNHLVSAGFDLKFYKLTHLRRYTVVGRFDVEDYVVKPYEIGFYIQDKIEYSGIIVNAGLRADAFNAGASEIDNYFAPYTVKTEQIQLGGANEVLTVNRYILRRNTAVKTKWLIGPRLGISHPISDKASMYYSFSRSMQIPPFSALYADAYAEMHGTLPNIWLVDQEPLKSTIYEMGLQYVISNYFGIDVSAYYKTIENYVPLAYGVTPRPGVAITYFIRFNGGYADSRGIELTLNSRALPIANLFKLSGKLTYAYSYIKSLVVSPDALRGQNVTAFSTLGGDSAKYGGKLPFENARYFAGYEMNVVSNLSSSFTGYDRPHRINLSLFFDFPSPFKGIPIDFRLSTFTTAASGFLYPLILADPRSRKLGEGPWNIRTDIKLEAGYSIGRIRISPYLEIKNLFDRENIIGYDRTTDEGQLLWEQKKIPTGPLGLTVFRDGTSAFDIAREIYFGISINF
ncbi:TonB-dependent Receptor Plug Domain [Candidatus Kryptobacter tengchongensis]|nr:TonB-dependent Receptor Plug Domain [Candidatus Kryptobacter tengchongensis]